MDVNHGFSGTRDLILPMSVAMSMGLMRALFMFSVFSTAASLPLLSTGREEESRKEECKHR
jgi:hypothetical protein